MLWWKCLPGVRVWEASRGSPTCRGSHLRNGAIPDWPAGGGKEQRSEESPNEGPPFCLVTLPGGCQLALWPTSTWKVASSTLGQGDFPETQGYLLTSFSITKKWQVFLLSCQEFFNLSVILAGPIPSWNSQENQSHLREVLQVRSDTVEIWFQKTHPQH